MLRIIGALALLLTASTEGQLGSPPLETGNAPVLYSDAPLSAQPGDLLQLTGLHISNAEKASMISINRASSHSATPDTFPVAIIVRSIDPERLTVKLPTDIDPNSSYVIAVMDKSGIASNGITVNSPKPEWFSPALISSVDDEETFPRILKIVGRNLSCAADCRARLYGSTQILLRPTLNSPLNDSGKTVLTFTLPKQIPAGKFWVEYSPDGIHWHTVDTGPLESMQPLHRQEVSLLDPRFGYCKPDDNRNDRPCLERALSFATEHRKTLILPVGRWDIDSGNGSPCATLLVPNNVWIRGERNRQTQLIHHCGKHAASLLTLMGNNRITGLWIGNAEGSNEAAALVQLGMGNSAHSAPELQNIAIYQNHFSSAEKAIVDAGIPVRNLQIINNEFRISGSAIYLVGNRSPLLPRFTLVNSTIVSNTFHSSGRSSHPSETPIASEIGGSKNLNFSDNRAVTDVIAKALSGWRAGYFFNLQDNHENILVQNNVVECAGSGGDGEAISLDNNANAFAYSDSRSINEATSSSVSVPGLPEDIQNGKPIDQQNYYRGHWLQIVQGTGIGQARRIEHYVIDKTIGTTTFFVLPAFAVAPDVHSSKVFISRLFTSPTIVGNIVDNRLTQCAKNNATGPHGGSISLWAQTQGGIIVRNHQFDSDGIIVKHTLGAARDNYACKDCEVGMIRHVNLDVSENSISGEYNHPSKCGSSGIVLRFGAAPVKTGLQPLIGMNIRILRNFIRQTDSVNGGAISSSLDWHSGASTFFGPLINGTIIEGNTIQDISGAVGKIRCGTRPGRIGINLSGSHLIRETFLHHNTCKQVPTPLLDGAHGTIRLCSNADYPNCECAFRSQHNSDSDGFY